MRAHDQFCPHCGVALRSIGALDVHPMMTAAVVPDGVFVLGRTPFWNCAALASVTIPVSVTKICIGTFAYCTALTDIRYGGTVTQ